MKKDQIYKEKLAEIKKFAFNEKVAAVFDDMVNRSIPFYQEIHHLILDIAQKFYKPNFKIYDLGCSTGNTILAIYQHLDGKEASFIGIDNSESMLKICDEKLNSHGVKVFDLLNENLEEINFENADMFIMNYTLQFIPTTKRAALLKKIYQSLNKGGVFILSEKIKSANITTNNLMTDLYYDFKRRNDYSELEIAQKRQALEDVLIPLTPEKQLALMQKSGFKKVDILFKWYNFACFIGIK